MSMYILSIFIASVAGVFYHISQKFIPAKANPLLSLIITFSVALLGSIIWYVLKGSLNTFSEDIKNVNWSSITLGLSIIGLEFGILLAYRSGWKISNFNLFYTFFLISMLIPIGLILFKEPITLKSIIGMGLAMCGILLMKS